ncbi:hypothetical protein CBR_g3145 [Chara braunii]|uniref:Uncharacterized protein n=1 Tax=Chara braunii TaxID=69332 RepID=A0A388KEW2_CHABU|nr:hypothetical protein CBR_g3145 [Chara braunii]|eukprot:GBG68602.1 hypothetical protein CBR_g3145 [Chara braunii]
MKRCGALWTRLSNWILAIAVAFPAFFLEHWFRTRCGHVAGVWRGGHGSWRASQTPVVLACLGTTDQRWRAFCSWGYDHPLAMANVIFFVNVCIMFWILDIIQQNGWLIDLYWTIIPVMMAHFFAAHPAAVANPTRACLVLILVWLWSLRLTHSYLRREGWKLGVREDWRYNDLRKTFKRDWWWMSFLLVYAFQQVLLVGLCLPIYAVFSSAEPLNLLDIAAAIACVIGVTIAYIADAQLHEFMKANDRRRAAKMRMRLVLNSGLWYYSRHPNYFGEQLFWLGMSAFGCAIGKSWVAVGVTMNSLCMACVTAMVEKRMLRDKRRADAYRRYQRMTSVWIPWAKAVRTPVPRPDNDNGNEDAPPPLGATSGGGDDHDTTPRS